MTTTWFNCIKRYYIHCTALLNHAFSHYHSYCPPFQRALSSSALGHIWRRPHQAGALQINPSAHLHSSITLQWGIRAAWTFRCQQHYMVGLHHTQYIYYPHRAIFIGQLEQRRFKVGSVCEL